MVPGRAGCDEPTKPVPSVAARIFTSGMTVTVTGLLFTTSVLSRYCVVAVGVSATDTVPSLRGATVLTAAQIVEPACCCSTVTLPTARARPVRENSVPYATGAAGCTSPSSPIVNHVERRPSACRKSAAAIAGPTVPSGPTPAICATRCEPFMVMRTSRTGPLIFSTLASLSGLIAAGFQSW